MPLVYQSDLEDVSEPSIRHYLRSKTARKAKIWSTFRGAVICAAAFLFIFRERCASVISMAGIAGATFGALINYYTFASTASKRIRKHIERETAGKLPATTSYDFNDGKLVCEHLGLTIAFPLSELKEVTEDEKRLEVFFGSIGLCTIPLRAFESSEAKANFIAALKSGKGGA